MPQPVPFTNTIYPVCLPPPVLTPTNYAGEMGTVAGWGCMEEDCQSGDRPVLLRDAVIPIIDNDLAMCW